MAERITDYRKYLDPLSSEYIEPGINPRASYTSGYSGPVGEMRGPRSKKLYSTGTTLSNYGLPGIGGALRNVGAGMKLEPTNYARSALEGLSFVPGAQPMTTAARLAAPTRAFATNYAAQPRLPQQRQLYSQNERNEAINNALKSLDIPRQQLWLRKLGFDPAINEEQYKKLNYQ